MTWNVLIFCYRIDVLLNFKSNMAILIIIYQRITLREKNQGEIFLKFVLHPLSEVNKSRGTNI